MDLPAPTDPSVLSQATLKARAEQITQAAGAAQKSQSQTDARKVAQDFEALFLNMMLKEMRKTVGKGGLLGDDAGTQVFQELMDTALADAMAKSSKFGLGDIVAKHMADRSRPNKTSN